MGKGSCFVFSSFKAIYFFSGYKGGGAGLMVVTMIAEG